MTDKQVSPDKGRAIAGSSQLGGYRAALRLFFRPQNFLEIPRLLHEGVGPIRRLFVQMHNTAELTRLIKEGAQVKFITSFPRSGNTWVRYLLSDIFLQGHGVETSTELPLGPDKLVPDFYCDWIARRDPTIPHPGVFVKAHDTFDQLEARFKASAARGGTGGNPGGSPIRRCKQLFLYRSPEDALVSYYHFMVGKKLATSATARGIDAFCLAHLGDWEENLASYVRAANEDVPVLFVPYELLLQYPAEILSSLLRWLGVKHDASIVDRAISNMQFTKLQAIEARSRVNEEAFFFRKGCKGAGRVELQSSTVAEIQEKTARLLEQAHSRAMMQQSLQHNPASSKTGQIRMAAALQNKHSKQPRPVTKLQII